MRKIRRELAPTWAAPKSRYYDAKDSGHFDGKRAPTWAAPKSRYYRCRLGDHAACERAPTWAAPQSRYYRSTPTRAGCARHRSNVGGSAEPLLPLAANTPLYLGQCQRHRALPLQIVLPPSIRLSFRTNTLVRGFRALQVATADT